MTQFAGLDDWIAVFRTGTHTDSSGKTREWTDGDLDEIVAQYDPAEHEAPVVIGHPKLNAPAYAWVKALKRKGEFLYAKLKDIVPEFADMVKRGLFKKRSIALYPDLSLRHIGFLGAVPPAVSGLPDIAFKDSQEVLVMEFSDEWLQRSLADLSRRLREWLIEKHDRDTADQVVPEWFIEQLSHEAGETSLFAASEAEKEAQKKRAKRYGIAIKEGGHVTKPSEWEEVPDDQFLDPVNYRYPCPNADQTRAAASYWGKEKNQKQYSQKERSLINERLDKFKRKFKIGEYRKEETIMSEFRTKLKNMLVSLGIDMSKVPDEAIPEEGEVKTFTEAEVEARANEAADKAARKAKEEKDKEFAERQKQERLETRKTETKAFCETLKKEGKLLPAWEKLGLQEFMLALDGEEVIEFAAETKVSRLDWFRQFMGELPKVINFKEIATRDKEIGTGSTAEKLEQFTRAKMKENKELTFRQAFSEVQKEHPDLAKEYQDGLGG